MIKEAAYLPASPPLSLPPSPMDCSTLQGLRELGFRMIVQFLPTSFLLRKNIIMGTPSILQGKLTYLLTGYSVAGLLIKEAAYLPASPPLSLSLPLPWIVRLCKD